MEQFFYSLHQSVKKSKGGISGVARKLGTLEKTLMSKLNPNDDTHIPKVDELIRIMDITGNTEPLEILCGMFGGRFVSKNSEMVDSVMQAALMVASESGDVMKAVVSALNDDDLSDGERLEIKREISDVRNKMNVLENTMDNVIKLKAKR